MSGSQKLKRNPDVSWRTLEGQAVLIFNKAGEVQVLNDVGTYIWEHIGEDPETMARVITERYEVPADEARRDAQEFLDGLLASGALLPDEP
jgi:hypothetical protein